MMTMHDLIEKLKVRPKTADEHREEQKRAWLGAVRDLYTQIEGWLGPAVREGVVKIMRSESERTDEELGSYLAPLLEIRSAGLLVRIEPVGPGVTDVVSAGGKRLVGLRGRVDLVCGPVRVPLARGSSGQWQAVPMRGEPRDLTEDTFAELLGEVLLDE
jgi:hypothetical protein